MSIRLPALWVACLGLAACVPTPTRTSKPEAMAAPAVAPARTPVPADDNLNAVAWTQTAIEHELIYRQTYRDAQDKLLAALRDRHWDALPKEDRPASNAGLKPAVVLDIDETVLDNSPYQVRLIKSGGEFNPAGWAAWCKQEAARGLPGAVEFTRFAAKHGIAVIYISNRATDLDQATLANLRKVGLPVSGPQAFLGLGTAVIGCAQVGTEKTCRRRLIGRKYRVLMQFGDQIGDFVGIPANTADGRAQAMAPYLTWIGERWFVLPNPTYGSWESALIGNDSGAPREQRRQLMRDSLRDQ